MQRSTAIATVTLAVLLGLAGIATATTWAEATIDCPVCQKKIQVKQVASFGSYIYRWPSRLQMLFWPYTDGAAIYFCKHCHAAWFMGDLDDLTPQKRAAITAAVTKVRQDQPDVPYDRIPVAYRLKMAMATYGQLGENDFFWSHFHRVGGYHLQAAGDEAGAKTARIEALAVTERMLAGELDQAQRKELLLVKGSMQYLTGRRDDSLATLAQARAVVVSPSADLPAEKAKGANEFLDEVIDALRGHVEKNEPLPQ